MPQNRNSKQEEQPPETMTWGRATPVLVLSVIFDLLRMMCEQLWFFGPAIVALYCADKVGDVAVVGGLLVKACIAGAAVAGAYGLPIIEALGLILAIAVGLLGWMTVGLIMIMTNGRIFKENAGNTVWFLGSLLISEVPFVGTLPALTGVTFKMYRTQIKKEKAALAAYNKQKEEDRVASRQQQAAALMRGAQEAAQMNEMAQFEEQEAANDEEMRRDEEAANDERYIPDKKYGTS